LIARQRDNLRRTFAHVDDTTLDTRITQRLARNEQELADATDEFTQGIEQIAGPIPCLHEALDAMHAATDELGQKELKGAKGFEETALAGLIKARQNLRKLLAQGGSSSSQCRQFDQQQKQKLRRPPKKDKKQQMAKEQQDLEELAKEEKNFSEEIASKSGGGAQLEQDPDAQKQQPSKGQKSSSPSDGQKPSESQSGLAERQEKAAEKAAELQKLIQEDDAVTELARNRMDKATEDVQASAKSMKDGQPKKAGEQAAEAAEELDRLARQVAGLKAADLETRVAQAESLAKQLAKAQQGLGKELDKGKAGEKKADEERRLAEEARTLADLLRRLQQDADEKNPDLGRQLREAAEANSPQDAADRMQRAAEALKAGKPGEARPDVDQSARTLEALGQQLGAARHALAGPQLDKLMALEKQAAETQKALESVNTEKQKAEADKKVTELREAIQAQQGNDPKLSEAANQLGPGGATWRRHDEVRPNGNHGMYVPPVTYEHAVPEIIKLLQGKIQEIILKDALLDKDEAVPPQYKKLVEDYYRILSEDLRR
jgi:hypothetical protein